VDLGGPVKRWFQKGHMSFLESLGVAKDIEARAAAEKKRHVELDNQASGQGFPEIDLPEKGSGIVSLAPGGGDFAEFAGIYAPDGDLLGFTEREARKQMEKLGIPENDIPPWAKFPERFVGQRSIPSLFVGGKGIKNSGSISYEDYPAARLRELGPQHPRNLALTIPGKFGLPHVRNHIYVYAIEHQMTNGLLDNQKLAQDIKGGNFLKLLRMNGQSYTALKSAAHAAQLSGHRYITDVHLIMQWADFSKRQYSFNINAVEPAWHTKELLPLVLKEVQRLGRPVENSEVKNLTDDEFAALVDAVIQSNRKGEQHPA